VVYGNVDLFADEPAVIAGWVVRPPGSAPQLMRDSLGGKPPIHVSSPAPQSPSRVPPESAREILASYLVVAGPAAVTLYGLVILLRLAGFRGTGVSFVVIIPAIAARGIIYERFRFGSLPVRLLVGVGWVLIAATVIFGHRLLPPALR
jgi:hypothetical protein